VRIGAIPTAEHGMAVDDAFFTDLASIDNGAWLRRGVADARGTVVALLAAEHVSDAAATLAELTGRPAYTIATEPEASARGARTTPGLPPDSIVCDIGGGTIDVVGAHRTVIAAGAGETITIAVSRVLGIPRALAERVKRTPALRVENPHIAHEEDGRRVFFDHAAPPDAIGWLCTRGSGGLVPFRPDWPPKSGAVCGWPSNRKPSPPTSPDVCEPSTDLRQRSCWPAEERSMTSCCARSENRYA
jgi:Diol dehydratase reactivase ATPase-like domain